MTLVRGLVVAAGLVALWEAVRQMFALPAFILPGPVAVAQVWVERLPLILANTWPTLVEILAGLVLGTLLGAGSALTMALFRPVQRWLMPVLVVSQAVPVFALAPLLALWFGYGIASKIAMATLIIFFPVTAALFDGLRRTDPGWIDLARTMGASRWTLLRHVRLPAALPAFASGLRVAAAVAPIGAVVGEWIGASHGLGHLMLHANARNQADLMFAALVTLAVLAVTLYFALDRLLRHLLPWQPESLNQGDR